MSVLKRVYRVGFWLLTNGITYLLLALGLMTGFGWAWNLYAFLSWLAVFIYGIQCLAKARPEFDRSVPAILDIIIDFGAAAACAAFGHWFYAILKLVEIVEYQHFYSKKEEPKPVEAPVK